MDEKETAAHIRVETNGIIIQPLLNHCMNAAKYAFSALKDVNLGVVAELAALMHDAGKASLAFQSYLYDVAVEGKKLQKGSVNHSSAGCRFFLEKYHNEELDISAITAELLAYACGAHHGLFDCLAKNNGFQSRITDPKLECDSIVDSLPGETKKLIDSLFPQATREIEAAVGIIGTLCENGADGEPDFYFGMLERLLLSAVMEGDRKDTAEFMSGKMYPRVDAENERLVMWKTASAFMEAKLDQMDDASPINRARRAISDQCAAYAEKSGGIIRLNVPTGAGKTLASLRYALRHAAKFNKSRIIFTSSLLSVLDQNAKVIRDFLPNPDMILEHHSNVVQPEQENEREEWEMMTEAWRSPVIVTTLVQLLNTMFLGKTSNIRRFHSLCNSVLVIDEVQTVPNNLLTLFNLTLNFLSEICGTTIVLCSATQPCLEKADHPLIAEIEDMVPYDEELWGAFHRTTLRRSKERRLEDIPELAAQILRDKNSVLIVCNMKKEAKTLFELCRDLNAMAFHLSAGMCMQHRRDTLTAMQSALNRKEKVLCISTQVIEAGVDISFESVIRFLAGMDSVVQSAGRCNRNGESTAPADVFIVECVGEQLGRLQIIKAGQTATSSLLEAFSRNPAIFDNCLTSQKAIEYYFGKLYRQMPNGYQDGCIPKTNKTLYGLLSSNLTGDPLEERFAMHQAFKTAGESFTVFDTDTVEAVVGYGEGRNLQRRLIGQSESFIPDYNEITLLIRQVKPYTVSLYRYQTEQLEKKGALNSLFEGRVKVLSDGFYDEFTGFTMDEQFWEV